MHCEEVRLLIKSCRFTIHDRKANRTQCDGVGGLQILIDLKGAFDRAPRHLLQQALMDLPLPPSILSLLLAWHDGTPYHLHHAEQDFFIDGNVGVRQGCVAAPLLWVAFMRHWKKHLEEHLGSSWVKRHLTVYADDNHLAWTFRDLGDIHQAILDATFVLNSFLTYGMHLNLDKTVAILVVRGRGASAIRRRYLVSESGRRFLCLHDALRLPLVSQHVYLGMCVSYGHYPKKTLSHRQNAARKSFMALRAWWTPSRLPLQQRIHLWKICIWPTLSYSLVEVGLSPAQCQPFCQMVFKQLRWITRSPSHITHESNKDLLIRLALTHPLLWLASMTVKHWAKKWNQCKHLPADDALQDRWSLLLLTPQSENHHVLLWVQFCFCWLREHEMEFPTEDASTLWDVLKGFGLSSMKDSYAHVFQTLSVAATQMQHDQQSHIDQDQQHACQYCEAVFRTLKGLRVHITKTHSQDMRQCTEQDHTMMLTRADGLGGLPICRVCRIRFQDWFAFDRHTARGVCLHSSSASAMTPIGTRTFERRTQEQPLIQRLDLLASLREDWQKTLSEHPELQDKLLHHCCICNQWFEKGWHLSHHGTVQHRDLFRKGRLHRNEMMLRKGIGPIKWTCPYCRAVFQSANVHYCTVLLQIAVLVVAPEVPHGHGNRVREGSPGNEHVQGPPPFQSTSCRRRFLGGGGQQEAAHTVSQQRRRIRQKSRPPQGWQQSIQQQTHERSADAGHVGGFSSIIHKTRGLDKHSASGHGLHALYEREDPWHGGSLVTSGGEMEIYAREDPHSHHQSIETDHVQGTHGGTHDEAPKALRGGCSSQECIRGGEESGGGGQQRGLSVSDMGLLPTMSDPSIPGSAEQGRGHERAQDFEHPPHPSSNTSLPQSEAAICQYELEDCSLHPRSQCANTRVAAGLDNPQQILSEWSHESGGSQHATCDFAALTSHKRSEEVIGEGWPIAKEHKADPDNTVLAMSHLSDVDRPSGQAREQSAYRGWLGMRMFNPSTVCYLNAGVSVIGWGILTLGDTLDTWEGIGALMTEALAQPQPCKLYSVAMSQILLHDWQDILRQHDVAELMGYLLGKLGNRKMSLGSWGSIYVDAGWVEYTESLAQPLPLAVPTECTNTSLQQLLNLWSEDAPRRSTLMSPAPGFFCLQVMRYTVSGGSVVKSHCEIEGLEDEIWIPVFDRDGARISNVKYHVLGMTLHYGESPTSGHYIALLRDAQLWWLKDDAKHPRTLARVEAEHRSRCYVLCLGRSVHHGSLSAGIRTSTSTPSS